MQSCQKVVKVVHIFFLGYQIKEDAKILKTKMNVTGLNNLKNNRPTFGYNLFF